MAAAVAATAHAIEVEIGAVIAVDAVDAAAVVDAVVGAVDAAAVVDVTAADTAVMVAAEAVTRTRPHGLADFRGLEIQLHRPREIVACFIHKAVHELSLLRRCCCGRGAV